MIAPSYTKSGSHSQNENQFIDNLMPRINDNVLGYDIEREYDKNSKLGRARRGDDIYSPGNGNLAILSIALQWLNLKKSIVLTNVSDHFLLQYEEKASLTETAIDQTDNGVTVRCPISVECFEQEVDMLERFIDLVTDPSVSCLVGHNCYQFDNVAIVSRCRKLLSNQSDVAAMNDTFRSKFNRFEANWCTNLSLGKLQFGRSATESEPGGVTFKRIEKLGLATRCTVNVDTYFTGLVHHSSTQKNFKLDSMMKHHGLSGKASSPTDFNMRSLAHLSLFDQTQFVCYNALDAVGTALVFAKRSGGGFYENIASICKSSTDNAVEWKVGFLANNLIQQNLMKKGQKMSAERFQFSIRFTGGAVRQSAPGTQEDVCIIDAASEQPNVMRSWNLSPECSWMYVPPYDRDLFDALGMLGDTECVFKIDASNAHYQIASSRIASGSADPAEIFDGLEIFCDPNRDVQRRVARSLLCRSNVLVRPDVTDTVGSSSHRVIILKSSDAMPAQQLLMIPCKRISVMAECVESLMRLKNASKGQADRYKASKMVINSLYGAMASKFVSAPFPALGAATTLGGRCVRETMERVMNESGYNVINSDTDSVFIHGVSSSSVAKTLTDKCSLEVRQRLDLNMSFDFEFWKRVRLTGRKKQQLLVDATDNLKVVGGPWIKRDCPQVMRDVLHQYFTNTIAKGYVQESHESGLAAVITEMSFQPELMNPSNQTNNARMQKMQISNGRVDYVKVVARLAKWASLEEK